MNLEDAYSLFSKHVQCMANLSKCLDIEKSCSECLYGVDDERLNEALEVCQNAIYNKIIACEEV